MVDKIRIGVSSCLLGEQVRWDGGHKRDPFVVDLLGLYFEWVPVCPEVEAGMGVPRETVQLTGKPENPRMIGTRSGRDWTSVMNRYALRRVREISHLDLSGYIFKKRSPSCGVERVPVYPGPGKPPELSGRGLFAAALCRQMPWLPVEEEGRLNDPQLRENFITRIFAFHRLQQLQRRFTVGRLVEFHTRHKYLLLAHDPRAYAALGRLVAQAKKVPAGQLKKQYAEALMTALKRPATPARHQNVLQHMLGFLRGSVPDAARRDIETAIRDYRRGLVPLIVPVTLMQHYARREKITYLEDQIYLNPHPRELMLRNHV